MVTRASSLSNCKVFIERMFLQGCHLRRLTCICFCCFRCPCMHPDVAFAWIPLQHCVIMASFLWPKTCLDNQRACEMAKKNIHSRCYCYRCLANRLMTCLVHQGRIGILWICGCTTETGAKLSLCRQLTCICTGHCIFAYSVVCRGPLVRCLGRRCSRLLGFCWL